MDINLYKNDDIPKRVRLEFPALTFTGMHVTENMTQSKAVNATTDWAMGIAAAQQLNFELININQLITDDMITGKEFIFYRGIRTSQQSLIDIYRSIDPDLLIINGNIAYSVDTGGLKIWAIEHQGPLDISNWNKIESLDFCWDDIELLEAAGATWDHFDQNVLNVPVFAVTELNAPEQPDAPVKTLWVINGKLYCGHSESPYVTVYTISGNTLIKEETPDLTAFDLDNINTYIKRGMVFNQTGEITTEYAKQYLNGYVVDYIESTFEFTQVGIFIADHPVRKNDNLITVTSYDHMTRFDVTVDDWLDSLTYPMTAGAWLQSLCNYVGVELATTTFFNSGFIVQKNFMASSVTGRQCIQWVAELSCNFADMTSDGKLRLRWYAPKDYNITASDYVTVSISEFTTKPIDKLQIKVTDNDLGVIVGEGTNLYTIQNNPLLYAESDAELRPTAEAIFARIDDFQLVPYNVDAKGNPMVDCGDIITLTTRKEQTIQAHVMSRKLTGVQVLRDSYTATGNILRAVQSNSVNTQLTMLRGRTDELSMTLDGTLNRLTDAEGNIASLELTLSGFELAINNNKLTFDEDGLTIYNGGFRINNGTEDIFKVASDGSGVEQTGSFTASQMDGTTERTVKIENGKITFFADSLELGSILSAYDGYYQENSIYISGIVNGMYTRRARLWRPYFYDEDKASYDLVTALEIPSVSSYLKFLVISV